MTIHNDGWGHRLSNNLPLQLSLLAAVTVIVVVLASFYVW